MLLKGLHRWEPRSDGFFANFRSDDLFDADEEVLDRRGLSGLIAQRDVVGLHLQDPTPAGSVHLFYTDTSHPPFETVRMASWQRWMKAVSGM